jgi:membrane protein DedA with SNARE-associated domain
MKTFLELVKSWGPLGALLLTFIDGLGLPNPGGPDYLVLFLAYANPKTASLSAAMAVLGSLTGTYCLYVLARKGGEKYLEKRAHGARARKFRHWFHRYGLVTVFIPALVPMVPLPMKAFVLCAGALGVRPLPFLATIAAGRIPRYFGLAYLGAQLGENSTTWLRDHAREFALAGLALLVFLFLLVRLTARFRVPAQDKLDANHVL